MQRLQVRKIFLHEQGAFIARVQYGEEGYHGEGLSWEDALGELRERLCREGLGDFKLEVPEKFEFLP